MASPAVSCRELPVVDLRGVDVHLGGQPVLRGLDLQLRSGESLGISGPNGSGKTTLLRLLATLLVPTRGEASLFGHRLGRGIATVRPRIALVGHEAALHPDLTLAENMALVAQLRGVEQCTALEVLDEVGLGAAAARRSVTCSAGMIRRAELARVRLTRPSLLLLDEPHASLDESARRLVDDVIREVIDDRGTVVMVSHETDRLETVIHRAHLSHGRLQALG